MNPKYTITWKDLVIKGFPAEGGGKNPKYNDKHSIDIGLDWQSAGVITVVFTDEDDLIVQCELNAVEICGYGKHKDWYNCTFEGEQ